MKSGVGGGAGAFDGAADAVAGLVFESVGEGGVGEGAAAETPLGGDDFLGEGLFEGSGESKYRVAQFIAANPERIYFNDRLWEGLQRYALTAATDSRLTKEERETLSAGERKLKDDQEERWRAYLILREVVRDAERPALRRKAAGLAAQCLMGISERFGREEEIRAAEGEMRRAMRG